MVKKKLELSKAKTNTLEDEIKLLKNQKPVQRKRLAQTTLAVNISPTITISKPKERRINYAPSDKNLSSILTTPSFSIHFHIKKQNDAIVDASKPSQSPEQPLTQVKYGNCKQIAN